MSTHTHTYIYRDFVEQLTRISEKQVFSNKYWEEKFCISGNNKKLETRLTVQLI